MRERPRERSAGTGVGRSPTRFGLGLAGAFLRRDFQDTVSYRFDFILDLGGILFTLAMFYFLAQLIDLPDGSNSGLAEELGSRGRDGLAAELRAGYFPFVLIGLAVYGYLGTGLRSFAAAVRIGQLEGTLEAMLATGTSLSAVVLCSSLWPFAYTSLEVVIYLAFGSLLFGAALGAANLPVTLLVLALSILAFSGLGILSAAFVLLFKRGDPVAYAVTGVSGLLGGVYFPVEVLPPWLRTLANWLPITHALRATRRTILQGGGLQAVSHELAMLLLFAALLLPLGLLAFAYAVRRARMNGSMGQY